MASNKLDKLAGKKSFEELLAEYVPENEEIKPSVTAGKSFVSTIMPEELQAPELKKYTEIKEGDYQNPTAAAIGAAGGAAFDMAMPGVPQKLGKEFVKGISANQKGAVGDLSKLSTQEVIKMQEALGKQVKDIKQLSPEQLEDFRTLAMKVGESREPLNVDKINQYTQVAINPKTGQYEPIIKEVETMMSFEHIPKGKGTNAVQLKSGEWVLPTEMQDKSIPALLKDSNPQAYHKLMGSTNVPLDDLKSDTAAWKEGVFQKIPLRDGYYLDNSGRPDMFIVTDKNGKQVGRIGINDFKTKSGNDIISTDSVYYLDKDTGLDIRDPKDVPAELKGLIAEGRDKLGKLFGTTTSDSRGITSKFAKDRYANTPGVVAVEGAGAGGETPVRALLKDRNWTGLAAELKAKGIDVDEKKVEELVKKYGGVALLGMLGIKQKE